jgi:hypothetical protein
VHEDNFNGVHQYGVKYGINNIIKYKGGVETETNYSHTFAFPDKSGTFALVEDLENLSPS